MSDTLDDIYHFNYPSVPAPQLFNRIVNVCAAQAANNPNVTVKLSFDDTLAVLRCQRRTGLSTEQFRVLLDGLMRKFGKAPVPLDMRTISSHLSRAYNLGLLDREYVEGVHDQVYNFPSLLRLDGTDSATTRMNRWNIGNQRRTERAIASVAGGEKRLTDLRKEQDEFQVKLAQMML